MSCLTVLLVTILSLVKVSSIDEAEFLALQLFYNGTNGNSWYDNTGWEFDKLNITAGDICPGNVPYALECWSYGDNLNHIQTIKFESDNGLRGTITDKIDGLSHLSAFRINFNHIYGTVPHSLFNNSILREIALYYTKNVTFEVSDKLCQLPELQVLDLEAIKNVNGTIPDCIGDLKKLRSLSITSDGITDHNYDLTGTIPSSLFNSSHILKHLGMFSILVHNCINLYCTHVERVKESYTVVAAVIQRLILIYNYIFT